MSTRRKAKAASPKTAAFALAVEAAEHLTLVDGLGAITGSEGKGQIVPGNATVESSVAVDEDCREAYPNHARWDYLVGATKPKATLPHAFFIEVHSAETSEVSKMEAKLDWLLQFLARPKQAALAKLPRSFHWVASGRINIPRHLPQYKKLVVTLRKRGLLGPHKQLTLA